MCRIYIGLATPILCAVFTLVLPHLYYVLDLHWSSLNLTLNMQELVKDLHRYVIIIQDLTLNLMQELL